MNVVTLYGTAVNDPSTRQASSGKIFATVRMRTVSKDGAGKEHDDYHTLVFWEAHAEEVASYAIKKGDFFGVMGRLTSGADRGGRFTDVLVTYVYPPMIPYEKKV